MYTCISWWVYGNIVCILLCLSIIINIHDSDHYFQQSLARGL